MKHHQSFVLAAFAIFAAFQFESSSRAQTSVSYAGGVYSQSFDTLPYTPGTGTVATEVNTANPVTVNGTQYTLNGSAYSSNTAAPPAGVFDFGAAIDTSGTIAGSQGGLGLAGSMPGWYGAAQTLLKYGANSGSQTTGGILSYGTNGGAGTTAANTDSNRALGLIATSTSGNTEFALKLINTTGVAINQIAFSFTGELWRQQTVARTISYGYFIDPNTADTVPMSGATTISSFGFATGTSTGSTINSTGPLASTAIQTGTVTLGTSWASGSALWLTFSAANVSGSQGLAIDNFSFVPEPSTWTMLVAGLGALLMFAWRRARGPQAIN